MANVKGTVAPGYESVKELFTKNLASGADINCQLCVYVKGEKVIDLWGSAPASYQPDPDYGPDTLQTIFSSTKSLTAICTACLIDRGLIDYDEKVAKYWPEFAQKGKEDIKICDVLRHEAGLASFSDLLVPKDMHPESLKSNYVGKIIEDEEPKFPPEDAGTKRQYHAVTRGLILSELCRRVDPKGRTIGELLRDEVSVPLEADAYIGARESELGRFTKLRFPSMAGSFLNAMLPKALGRKFEPTAFDILHMFKMFAQLKPTRKPLNGEEPPEFFSSTNTDDFRKAEAPSTNGSCSARGLAAIASQMAQKGGKIMSTETWNKMHDGETVSNFHMSPNEVGFTQGGLAVFRSDLTGDRMGKLSAGLRDGYYGWFGMGGSIFQWHPELEIGFGFTLNNIYWFDGLNCKGAYLQKEVVDCARKLAGKNLLRR